MHRRKSSIVESAGLDIQRAASVSEIRASLAQLSRQEASVTARLDVLVESQNELSRELGRLDLIRAQLGSQAVNARNVSNGMLSDAASTANRISSAVKRLDREQSNVKATLEVVEQVSELKACVLGVHGSMGAAQDWETAAGYINRASRIPQQVVDSSFAEEIVPTAEVPDAPRITLNDAAESLCGLFLRAFEKAAKEADGEKVARFFKLFPLIGRSEVGLDAYGRFVCHGVATRARTTFNAADAKQRKEGYFYGNALTKLFEQIAQIANDHETLVENHYGAGTMLKVIERLQVEVDVQGGIILDTWYDERMVERRLTDIKSYAFSFLVQSFLPVPKMGQGTPRSGSPMNATAAGEGEEEGVDMKEVDGLLGESGFMLGRWALYLGFLASRFVTPEGVARPSTDRTNLPIPRFLSDSNMQKKVLKHLIEPFNAMTTFFFRRSVEKAFQLDEQPLDLSLSLSKSLGSNPPFISSAVDDVMYIVNQVLQRSLATSQRTVIGSVLPTVARVLGSDFVGMIQRKMRDESYPNPVVQGSLPPENKVIAFLVLINNLDVANDYIKRIVETNLGPTTYQLSQSSDSKAPARRMADLFPFGNDAAFVESNLLSLQSTFESKTSDLISESINVTLAYVIRPRIRPIFAEAFRDIDYQPDSSSHNDAHSPADHGPDNPDADAELVKTRFERAWLALTRPIRRILTERNFDRLLTATVVSLSKALEARIKSYYGRVNELGAVHMERDVSGVIAAAVQGGRYGLRDAFARCAQTVLIMNMEDEEWEEMGAGDDAEDDAGIVWVLDKQERTRARAIVKDRG